MIKDEAIAYLKEFDRGYGYQPEGALESAKDAGYITEYDWIASEDTGERRWGVDRETIYKVDDTYLQFDVYHMIGDEGDDLLEGIHEVKPVEVTTTKWEMV